MAPTPAISLPLAYVLSSQTLVQTQSQNYVTTDGQSSSLSWCKAHIWGLRPDLYYWSESCGFADVASSIR
jgi:hypothetical protein